MHAYTDNPTPPASITVATTIDWESRTVSTRSLLLDHRGDEVGSYEHVERGHFAGGDYACRIMRELVYEASQLILPF